MIRNWLYIWRIYGINTFLMPLRNENISNFVSQSDVIFQFLVIMQKWQANYRHRSTPRRHDSNGYSLFGRKILRLYYIKSTFVLISKRTGLFTILIVLFDPNQYTLLLESRTMEEAKLAETCIGWLVFISSNKEMTRGFS